MKVLHKRSLFRRFAVSVVASLAGLNALPVGAASTTASATAEVLTPIAVTKSTDLVFGNLIAGNGDVTLSTASARTKTGGTVALLTPGATPTAARFDVTGTGSATFSIDYTGSSATLASGGNSMAITWISEVSATTTPAGVTSGSAATGALTSGAAYIFVGGVLTVGAGQAAGTYTGTISVTVAYN